MRSRRSWRAAASLAAALAAGLDAAACGTVKTPTEPDGLGGGPAFTFTMIQQQIFTPSCAKGGCHDAATANNGLILEAGSSYALLVQHPSLGNPALDRVEPGDPERSYLIKKLRGDPDITGQRMPFDGPPFLTPEQIDGIAGWILAGAPQN
jgi:hypothetical protein